MIEQWRALFARCPQQAVTDLFSGRAGLGARINVPEILYYEFLESQPQRREQLDVALLKWLCDMRQNQEVQVKQLGLAVYALRLCYALQGIHMLRLPRSTRQLCDLQEGWLNFLLPLRVAPERDPALELQRIVACCQSSSLTCNGDCFVPESN